MDDVSVEYNVIDKFYMLNIDKYLMVKNNIKQQSNLSNKCLLHYFSFSESLASIVKTAGHMKCIYLNNQQCI